MLTSLVQNFFMDYPTSPVALFNALFVYMSYFIYLPIELEFA